jgi:hypothetical protein
LRPTILRFRHILVANPGGLLDQPEALPSHFLRGMGASLVAVQARWELGVSRPAKSEQSRGRVDPLKSCLNGTFAHSIVGRGPIRYQYDCLNEFTAEFSQVQVPVFPLACLTCRRIGAGDDGQMLNRPQARPLTPPDL